MASPDRRWPGGAVTLARSALAGLLAAALLGSCLLVPAASARAAEADPFDTSTLGSTIWVPEAPAAGPAPDYVEPGVAWNPAMTTTHTDERDFEPFSIGGIAMTVSRKSGHLTVGVRDALIAGPAAPLAFDRVYDSGGEASFVGIGWASTLDRGLRIEGLDAVVYSPTGPRLIFEGDGRGFTATTPGSGATFTKVAESAERAYLLEEGSVRQFYSQTGYLTAEVDAEGKGNVYRYDVSGRLILAEQLGTGASLHFEYDGGLLTGVRDSAGRTTTYRHDSFGHLTSVTSRTNVTSTFGYDYLGRLASVTTSAAEGARMSVDYDWSNRVTSVIRSNASLPSALTRFDWSATALTVTDARGSVRPFAYDRQPPASVPTFEPDDLRAAPPGFVANLTVLEYDGVGRLTTLVRRSTVDEPGLVASYAYDRDDRVVRVVATDGAVSWFGHNPDGTMAYSLDGSGRLTRFLYDGNGRLIETVTSSLTNDAVPIVSTFERDASGNPTAIAVDGQSTRYTYGPTNLVTSIEEPGGDCATAGNSPPAASGCTLILYDPQDREALRIFPGGAMQSTFYDSHGTAVRMDAVDGHGAAVLGLTYNYYPSGDSQGLVRSKTSTGEEGIGDGAVTTYNYDKQHRLVSATEVSVTMAPGTTSRAWWHFGYDDAGDRVSQARTGATSVDHGPNAGRSSVRYRYNDRGQLISTSADGNLRSYDSAGKQVSPAPPNPATDAAVDSSTIRTAGGGLIGYRDGGSHYYVTDLQGSVVGVFDSAGIYEGGLSYSPFGELRAIGPGVAAIPHRFVGGLEDQSRPGIYRVGVRYYDSSLGRYLTPNPLDPSTLSYGYVNQDPVNRVSNGMLSTAIALRLVTLVSLGLEMLACQRGSFDACFLLFGVAWMSAASSIAADVAVDDMDEVAEATGLFIYTSLEIYPMLVSGLTFFGMLFLRQGEAAFEDQRLNFGWPGGP